MVRSTFSGLRWLPVSVGLCTAACGIFGASGRHVAPPPSTGPDCAAWEGPSAPTLYAAPSELRAAIRRQAEQGAVAVRFQRAGCDLRIEILESCLVAATYNFELRPGAETKQRLGQPLEILNAASIAGLGWVPLLEKPGAVGLVAARLGALRLPVPLRLPRNALDAEGCRGATHLVSAIELGRFRAFAGTAPEVDRVLAGQPPSAPGALETIAEVGAPESCTRAAREARPLIGCDEPLALHLMAVSGTQVESAAVSSMVSIPDGSFMRGEDGAAKDRAPARSIHVDAFEIDRFEVTAAEYAACVTAGSCAAPESGPFCTAGVLGKERHPVNCIDHSRAAAYCAFAGKRLPTEAEWEKAARAPDGRLFSWGNEWPPPKGAGNFADEIAARAFPYWTRINGYSDGYAATAPVDAFVGPTVAQTSGNVAEWVSDFYDDDYYEKGPDQNPTGPKRGVYFVVRGGHFGAGELDQLKLTRRDGRSAARASMYFGVRCARTPESPPGTGDLPEGEAPSPSGR